MPWFGERLWWALELKSVKLEGEELSHSEFLVDIIVGGRNVR